MINYLEIIAIVIAMMILKIVEIIQTFNKERKDYGNRKEK